MGAQGRGIPRHSRRRAYRWLQAVATADREGSILLIDGSDAIVTETLELFCSSRWALTAATFARAATHGEDYLRSGLDDHQIEDAEWAALERFRLFEARVEREGLCDLNVLSAEWSKLREAA